MNFKIAVCFALLAVAGAFGQQPSNCGPDLASSLRIVDKLCQPGNHGYIVSSLIYGCYQLVQPKKFIFDQCQTEVFGSPLSSKAALDKACPTFNTTMALYNDCLVKAFPAYGYTINDLIAAGTRINGCQGMIVMTC